MFPDLFFWRRAVLGNERLVLLTGCPRQGPAPCCKSGVANATGEDLHEVIRPETLSLGHDKSCLSTNKLPLFSFAYKIGRCWSQKLPLRSVCLWGEFRIVSRNDTAM